MAVTRTPEDPASRRSARRDGPAARRIVVLQLSFIGDMVFTTPLLDELRECFPGAEITVVGKPVALGVLEDHPSVDRTIAYDKQSADRGARGLLRIALAVRRLRPDVVLGVTRSGRTAALARLSRAPLRIGFDGPLRALAFTHTVARDDEHRSFPERPLGLLEPLGIRPAPRRLHLVVGPARLERARARLAAAGWRDEPLVAIAPGANYATKRWPERHVAALLDTLLAGGRLRPALFGGPAERGLIARLVRGRPGVLDRGDLPLADATAEIALARVLLAGDSGPAHIARALGVPTVILVGPTDPRQVADGGPLTTLRLGLECQPCSPGGDDRCPLGHHRCLEDLAPGAVLDAVLRAAAAP